jgi:hypothetical protein
VAGVVEIRTYKPLPIDLAGEAFRHEAELLEQRLSVD